ncbi:MAG: hypothetical protein ABFD00_04995 [Chloroherpetonaceae bacterium]
MNKLKIYYIVRNDKVGWDEYNSAVVIAHDKAEAVDILKRQHGDDFFYCQWKSYDVSVFEVIPDKPRIIIESYNAG